MGTPLRLAFVLLVVLLLGAGTAHAHNINYAMEQAPVKDVLWFYLKLGVSHIIPYGIDHILFVVCLCLLHTSWKSILWQASAFTVAHTITLALSAKGMVQIPAEIVEPVIALSIVYVAMENLLVKELKPTRMLVVFFFGLIHGLGFAGALSETGLPRNRFFESIIGFNIGVEIGQVLVIGLVYALIILPLKNKFIYRKYVVYPSSVCIILIAGFWAWQRVNSF